MGNKGFTLVEVLAVVFVIGIVGLVVVNYVGDTLSIGKSEAYNVMKDNILSSGYDYYNECMAGMISCSLDLDENRMVFFASDLRDVGYFSDLSSPIDGKDLGSCISLVAVFDDGNVDISLVDSCY